LNVIAIEPTGHKTAVLALAIVVTAIEVGSTLERLQKIVAQW
jgi:hypothetical protein